MRVLFLYVSTNMCRDGDLWFYDEGVAAAVAELRLRGHDAALRLVRPGETTADLKSWVDAQRQEPGTPPLLCFLTSVHFSAYAHDIPDTFLGVTDLGPGTGLRTAFAGLWATLNADALLDHPGVDLVVRGELDAALPDLCDALASGRSPHGLPNVWSQDGATRHRPALRPLVQDLDERPLPARDLLPIAEHANERDGILTVLASRGCPMACEFCTHVVLRKAYDVRPATYMRFKSVDRIFSEIHDARRRMPDLWGIYFHDDMFLISEPWRREFFARYRDEVGLEFGCNLVIGQIREDLIAQLAAAGCSHVLVGVESGSPRMREKILGKPLEDERIVAAIRLCQRHGLRVKCYALIGSPGEDRSELVRSLKGFARYAPDMVQVQVWLAHETSELLDKGREAAAIGRRLYERSEDRQAWRLKFYFHAYQRYIALYMLLAEEARHAPFRARIARALVTLSIRLPFAPDMLATHDWGGRRRWPDQLRPLAVRLLRLFGGRLAARLLGASGALDDRLSADYLKPDSVAEGLSGWRGNARLDRRKQAARQPSGRTASATAQAIA